MKYQINNIEQYGRRNSLRINNLRINANVKTEDEMIEVVTHFMNNHVLVQDTSIMGAAASLNQLDPISPSDVERCHFVGRSKKQILVKFSRYHDKRRIYMNKKKLKNNPDKIFITGDLTKANHELVKFLMDEQYGKKSIFGFWTRDGNIFVKRNKDDNPWSVWLVISFSEYPCYKQTYFCLICGWRIRLNDP